MVSLVKIDFEELKNFVRTAYEGDEDLLTKYHIDNFTLDEAVNSTLEMIEKTNDEVNMDYFGAVINGQRVGYICTFRNNLYSFGVNMSYRNSQILSEFWERIKDILGDNFMTVLYQNNTRAINWAKRCGMKEQECVVLLYNN